MLLTKIKEVLNREKVEVWRGGKISLAFLNRHNEFKECIQRFLEKFSDVFDSPSEILCWLVNPVKLKKCVVCGGRIKYSTLKNRPSTMFCSRACASTETGKRLIHEKSKEAVQEKYGVSNNFLVNKEKNIERAKEGRFRKALAAVEEKLKEASLSIEGGITSFYDGEGRRKQFTMRCEKCGTVFKREIRKVSNFSTFCPKCNHLHLSWSSGEREVADYLNSLGIPLTLNSRRIIKGVEIDMYSEKHKVAIEYDGLYWHSEERGKRKEYHLAKTINAENNGIRLIHIFEDEWVKQKSIVQSRLRVIFGMETERYYARKCALKELSSKESQVFLTSHHLQGNCSSSVRYGLFHDDELVAVMTFGKPRFRKEYDWELLRYASKGVVVGGAGKLLKHFKRQHEGTIISYADKRWSQGGLYRKLGFVQLPDTQPSPSYFKRNTIDRLNHVRFRKGNLKKELTAFDAEKSVSENLQENDYLKIWDCGSMVFVDGIEL